MARLRFDNDRAAFLASRVMLRQSLSVASGCLPASFVFSTHVHGEKPTVVDPPQARAVHFSLTHTDGLVACALTRVGAVGIDAEPVARPMRLDLLARRVLSPHEWDVFDRVPEWDRARRFFEYWCVKEACLKAEGTGLRVAPAGVSLRFTGGAVQFDDHARDARWAVRMLDLHPAYVTAVVVPGAGRPSEVPSVKVERFTAPSPPA